MLITGDLLSEVLIFAFGGGAVGKLVGAQSQVLTAERLHIGWRRYRLIGAPEAAAALGLLAGFAIAPLGAAAALGLVLLMAGALGFRIRVRDSAAFMLADGLLLALAATTAHRFRMTSHLEKVKADATGRSPRRSSPPAPSSLWPDSQAIGLMSWK